MMWDPGCVSWKLERLGVHGLGEFPVDLPTCAHNSTRLVMSPSCDGADSGRGFGNSSIVQVNSSSSERLLNGGMPGVDVCQTNPVRFMPSQMKP
jgi:hypothetical protein